jgi:IS5 family transposase
MNFSRSSTGYLARQGYIARGGQILDASIVLVPHNYNKRAENASIKSDETPEGRADKRSQKDVDAHWTRKHGKSRYSHKNHPDVDLKHKLIRRYHVSPSRDIAWQCPAGQWMPPRRCCRAWQSGGGSIVDAVKHLFQGPADAACRSAGIEAGPKARKLTTHIHRPWQARQAGQAAAPAGPVEQPHQIHTAGPDRAYLWRAGQ